MVDRAFAFALTGVAGRDVGASGFAALARALTAAGVSAFGTGVTLAGTGAVVAVDGGGSAIVTGADGAGTAAAGWLVGVATTPVVAAVESDTGSPSSPSMNGFAIQS